MYNSVLRGAPHEADMFEQRVLSFVALALLAPAPVGHPMAIAWEVTGEWRLAGRVSALKSGDLLPPGSLVTGQGSGSHHLIVLQPDGQRLFLDCPDTASCSRRFRLPALTQTVDEETIATFQQVSAMREVEVERAGNATGRSEQDLIVAREAPNLLRFEAVAEPEGDGSVDLATAMKGLPPGNYRLIVKGASEAMERPINWDGTHMTPNLLLAGTGLYDLRFYGTLNTERMRGHLLIVGNADFESASARFARLKEILTQWNERSPGWPIHDFLLSYLESISTKSRSN